MRKTSFLATSIFLALFLTNCAKKAETPMDNLRKLFIDSQIFTAEDMKSTRVSINQYYGKVKFDEIIKGELTSLNDFDRVDERPSFAVTDLQFSGGQIVTKTVSDGTSNDIVVKFSYEEEDTGIVEYWFFENVLGFKIDYRFQNDSTVIWKMFLPKDGTVILNNTNSTEFFQESYDFDYDLEGKKILVLNDCGKPKEIIHYSEIQYEDSEEINPLTGKPFGGGGESKTTSRYFYDDNCNLIKKIYCWGTGSCLPTEEYFYVDNVLKEMTVKEFENDSTLLKKSQYEYYPNPANWTKRVETSMEILNSRTRYYILEKAVQN